MNERDQTIEAIKLSQLLDGEDISVLREFESSKSVADEFTLRYCSKRKPTVVLCGINPGRLGAGKTGVPFLDFCSLSKLLPNVNRDESERSASFFYEVVEYFGAKAFYETFHVTNISSVGFERRGKNLNYYDLPDKALKYVLKEFKREMELVNPVAVISLASSVHNTVNSVLSDYAMNTSSSLPHPNYCAFPKQKDRCKKEYIELLSQYLSG